MGDNFFVRLIRQESKTLFKLKQSQRLWHIPLMAMLATGVPLLTGWYFDNLSAGLLACLSGLVILYLPSNIPTPQRMLTMLVCSFGFMLSFAVGITFSFNLYLSALVFGLFTTAVHWITLYFKTPPPGSFFFIMVASMSSNMPFDLASIPTRLGYVAMGTMFACSLAMIYSLLIGKKYNSKTAIPQIYHVPIKEQVEYLIRSLIVGGFLSFSLLTGNLLKLDNPYWIPISCAAIMQGITLYHVWQRALQRIAGTFVGLALCWLLISLSDSPLYFCICIMVLQFIIEMFISRNYAVAVIFITALTVLLAEAGSTMITTPNLLIQSRFLDIVIGSLIGGIGGWFLHHEYLRKQTRDSLRNTRLQLLRKKRAIVKSKR
ncbi:FUSC family protein [Myroides pelagicus]|uniref:FUSC family protein n=1 Tax=Myroides pelagicus TaxID=270914 RepID=A0A7K1GNH2_9FLAO|nr:FUSC family protein [Myroides pelagicus]MEC4113382.1 FUSC family protein [Myroides pelagicus]MTH30280.1 FUSC family protein [Myroides pelagicus]